MARLRRVLLIGAALRRSVQLLGSGGVERVVTGPKVRREWGPVHIRGSLGSSKPFSEAIYAISRRVLCIVLGDIRIVSRKWWCQAGRHGTLGPS